MKQLITDQLIEEHQKELDDIDNLIENDIEERKEERLYIRQDMLIKILARLEHLRQQEIQNVIDVYKDGDVLKHLYQDGQDYFNQTFNQPTK